MKATTRRSRTRLGAVCLAAVSLLTFTGSPRAAAEVPGRTATAAELTDATLGYRADSRADGLVVGATAAPPYEKLWSRDFGTVVSAPVAVGDRVYAVVNADDGTAGGPRMMLVGVRAATGEDLWPAVRLEQNEPQAGVSYGGGLLYLQDGRGTALALRADTGARVWTAPLADYSEGPTVVDGSGVWIGFDGIAWHHLALKTGAELHRFEVPDVSGAYGNPVALGAGAAWMRSSDSDDETVTAYDQKTGAAVRELPADATPVFGPGRVYVAHHGTVSALGTSTYKAAWTYTSSVGAATVRLVAGGYVYVQDADGRLVVLDAETGEAVWSYRRYPAPPPTSTVLAEEDWRGFVVPGIATAGGRLFVPADEGTLIAFGKA
ncbi:hypothetical protein ACE1SV_62440 [Streptomyces sp. E-15]